MSDPTYNSSSVRVLRTAGYKLTGPRLKILEILEKSNGHMTAAEVLSAVEREDPSIGRASVFRTLELLIKLGIVWTSVQGGSTVNYMLMSGGHHHHIICTRCQRRIEFEHCGLATLIETLEAQHGVQIDGHLLEMYGLCQACLEAEPAHGLPD
jgi:Fur family ferric uptake transcriptional regulator